jgi:methylmalonyl-CoA mutase cobalamin-binding subunit
MDDSSDNVLGAIFSSSAAAAAGVEADSAPTSASTANDTRLASTNGPGIAMSSFDRRKQKLSRYIEDKAEESGSDVSDDESEDDVEDAPGADGYIQAGR